VRRLVSGIASIAVGVTWIVADRVFGARVDDFLRWEWAPFIVTVGFAAAWLIYTFALSPRLGPTSERFQEGLDTMIDWLYLEENRRGISRQGRERERAPIVYREEKYQQLDLPKPKPLRRARPRVEPGSVNAPQSSEVAERTRKRAQVDQLLKAAADRRDVALNEMGWNSPHESDYDRHVNNLHQWQLWVAEQVGEVAPDLEGGFRSLAGPMIDPKTFAWTFEGEGQRGAIRPHYTAWLDALRWLYEQV
jgi:hypothetical protein